MKTWFITLIFLFINTSVCAQETRHIGIFWPQFTLHRQAGKRFEHEHTVFTRLLDQPFPVQLLALSNVLSMRLDSTGWNLALGYAFAHLPVAEQGDRYAVLYQLQLVHRGPGHGRTVFLKRLGYDYLQLRQWNNGDQLLGNHRMRLLFGVIRQMNHRWSLSANNEIFIIQNRKLLSENRFQLGIQFSLDAIHSFAASYFNRWSTQDRPIPTDLFEHALMLQWRISLKKKAG